MEPGQLKTMFDELAHALNEGYAGYAFQCTLRLVRCGMTPDEIESWIANHYG